MLLALPPCQNCQNRELNFANRRRHCHADGLKHFAAYALCLAANRKLIAVFFYVGLLQRLQILLDMRPFEDMACLLKMTFEFLAQKESQKAAEDMSTDGIVALMEDGASLQHGLHVLENTFDLPKLLVFERNLVGGKLRIRAQDPLATKARFGFHFFIINRGPVLIKLH